MIAGSGDRAYERELRGLASALRVRNLVFRGPVYGEAKLDLLFSADLYVLPSFTENFAISVAEAMACGLPVITTDRTPWSLLPEKAAGWCIAAGEDSLTDCLSDALGLAPEALQAMGRNGREWMKNDYSWEVVANKSLRTYEWLSGGCRRPEWIEE